MAIYSGDQNEITQPKTVGPTAVAVADLVDPASMPYCPTPDICKMRTGSVCCNFGVGGQLGDVSSLVIISPLDFAQSQMLPTGSSPNSLLKPPRFL